jgi:hypothetical protein
MMIHAGIEELKAGMILAHAVKNNQGVLLLEAGAKITKKNIRIFKSWGVTRVAVKGGEARANGTAGQPQPQIKESDEMLLKEKFADVLDDPVMVEIFNSASRQLHKDLLNSENSDEQ